jgi:serine/threonine protein kinase/tetratricopeptide (TPR) repeat protein
MPVTWIQVRDVLDQALQLAPEARSRYLDGACPRVELRRYVDSLIISYDKANEFLERPAFDRTEGLWNDTESSKAWVGRRIGPYRIEEEIGEGGMGTVFRAVRADDEYHKRVAIKLVRGGFDSNFALAQFKEERQILAGLEHPNIARLLDGGRTEEGYPYLVMELVDGMPIDQYCDTHRLAIVERLQLFRIVCDAVQFAHQNLIIHRDLKPANILVSADGVPKLLDFGIAKLLTNESLSPASAQTVSFLRMMTPEYASPEQVWGGPISTATDVYSLGVVLYILLTGHHPYQLTGNSPQALLDIICNTEPAKPSEIVVRTRRVGAPGGDSGLTITAESVSSPRGSKPDKLRHRLSGDLDNIVLMSLRKDSQRRYSSVEQFSDDIRRHLEGLPVRAREDTFAYRSSKFVKRHKLAVAAIILFVITLLGGIIATTREARIARSQRVKAERRFNDVRELANSLMFDVHDSIKDLPGATPARKLLVDRALRYLDGLSKEGSGDLSLQGELAASYQKVGDVQGNPYYANLGDTSGALVSYRKAAAIREAMLQHDPGNDSLKWSLLGNYIAIGSCFEAAQDFPAALTSMRKATALADGLLPQVRDPMALDHAAGAYFFMASILKDRGDQAGALENYRKAVRIRNSAQPVTPAQRALLRTHLAGDYAGMARVLADQGQLESAIEAQRQATALLEELSAADPTNATTRGFLADSYQFLGTDLKDSGDLDAGLHYLRKAQKICQELAAADTSNVLAYYRLGYTDLAIGDALVRKRNIEKGIGSVAEALAIFGRLAMAHPDNQWNRQGLAEAYSALGDAYQYLARDPHSSRSSQLDYWRTARSNYQESLNTLSESQALSALRGEHGGNLAKIDSQNMLACDAAIKSQHRLGATQTGGPRQPGYGWRR